MFCSKKWLFLMISFLSLGGNFFAGDGSEKGTLSSDESKKQLDKNDMKLADAYKVERARLLENELLNLDPSIQEAALKKFDQAYMQGRWEDVFLKHKSILYSNSPDYLKSNPLYKKLVLPSEVAIMVAIVATVPRLFTTVFCDGILQEGAQRLYKKIHNVVYSSNLIITSSVDDDLSLDDLVLEPGTHRQLLVNIGAFSNIAKNSGRAQFNGLLFHGLPGTGKTEAARVMASMIIRQEDVFYHELSGDVLATASREELRDLINSLRAYRKPTIVLIDECEKFLLDRRLGIRKGEKMPEGLSEWLNFTSKPSKNIQFIYTTNYKDKIDKAMLRRMQSIEFVLPDSSARFQLLSIFFKKYFLQDSVYTEHEHALMRKIFTSKYLKSIADDLVYDRKDRNGAIVKEDKYSPADIENIVNDIKNFSIAVSERGIPTKEFFEQVISRAMQVKKEEIQTEERLFGSKNMFIATAA